MSLWLTVSATRQNKLGVAGDSAIPKGSKLPFILQLYFLFSFPEKFNRAHVSDVFEAHFWQFTCFFKRFGDGNVELVIFGCEYAVFKRDVDCGVLYVSVAE